MELTKEQLADMVARIEELLAERRITKKQFYSGAGISGPAFSQWRTGARSPSTQSLTAIAQYLDVSLNWLLTGEDKTMDDASALREEFRRRPSLRLLFDAVRDLPESAMYETLALVMKFKEGNK